MEEIRFYRSSGPYGYLSNLFLCPISFEGRTFPSSEHAYQYGKPIKKAVADWIVAAPTASLCAQAAHALLSWQVRSEWSQIKVDRMRAVLRAKFNQHPELATLLAQTGESQLIEESSTDAFWGIGKRGNGQNMLGQLLMELRCTL